MTSGKATRGEATFPAWSNTFCRFVDRLNGGVGWLLGPMIVFVSVAIVYEVVSRSVFNVATLWTNETVVYGSAAVYLLTGGYALLHRRHVRIDVIFGALSERARRRLDLIALPFLVIYALTLLVVGGEIAWTSFLQAEGTGTPWNPRIRRLARHRPAARIRRRRHRGDLRPAPVWPPGLTLVVSRVFTLLGNNVLVSVPLFVFMACILERSGIAEDIFSAVCAWAGRLPGGLAVAVIITSTLMAAMVGVLGAEVVTIGIVALPAMLARGYKKDLALGCICAGGGLSTLIPPSVVFIMYGLTAGMSIGQLYIAGIVPGLLLASLYVGYIIVRAKLDPSIAPIDLSTEASLSSPDVVTAWVALTNSDASNGAMEVVPGTHLLDQVPHKDTFDDNNLLTRGQEIAVDIDTSRAVRLHLKPGEMSLHHVRIVHGSPPNHSNDRRIGFAIRYIPTSVRQIHGDDSATLVRGEDRYRSFDHEPIPKADLEPEMLALHKRLTERSAQILYRGTQIKSYNDDAAKGTFR